MWEYRWKCGVRKARSGGRRSYKLMPNPNNGNFALSQLYPDTKAVTIDIWNSMGENVYNSKIQFINGIANIKLNDLNPGLYMINITNKRRKEL